MKFWLLSDIHLDCNPWQWSHVAEINRSYPVVVAGDIANDIKVVCTWISQLRKMFDNVIWVAGNHCMYNQGFFKTRLYDSQWETQWPYPTNTHEIYDHYARWSAAHDIHFLNRSHVQVGGVEFIGATGWHNFDGSQYLTQNSQIDAWERYMSDSKWIDWAHDDQSQAVMQAARQDADYLLHRVKVNQLPKVVITHHVPHRQFIKITTDPVWNMLNGSFVNSWLEAVQDPSICVWCYGHTHFRGDVDVQGIRYINNARGYMHENPSWEPILVDVC